MGKSNGKGRSKYEPFVRLHRGVTNSAAWKSLSAEARCLLIEIWTRHNGVNNGSIAFSHREARQALRIGNGKVQQAFQELQDKGFLIARARGSFAWKLGAGQGRATEWEITTEPCDGKPAKASYRKWQESAEHGPDSGTAGSYSGNRSSDKIVKLRASGS